MRIKVIKSKTDVVLEYIKVKDTKEVRLKLLRYIVNMANESITFIIDTNIKVQTISIEKIKEALGSAKAEYTIAPILRNEKKMLDLSGFFKKKKKPKPVENIIIMKLNKDTYNEDVFNDFLRYYDYGIAIDNDMTSEELLNTTSGALEELLFNKEFIETSFYDSVLFSRFRSDSMDAELLDFLKELTKP